MKYYTEKHYVSNDKNTNIYIRFYSTKAGFLKFHIQIYKEITWNNNGFCSCVADYKTSDDALLNYLKNSKEFQLVA